MGSPCCCCSLLGVVPELALGFPLAFRRPSFCASFLFRVVPRAFLALSLGSPALAGLCPRRVGVASVCSAPRRGLPLRFFPAASLGRRRFGNFVVPGGPPEPSFRKGRRLPSMVPCGAVVWRVRALVPRLPPLLPSRIGRAYLVPALGRRVGACRGDFARSVARLRWPRRKAAREKRWTSARSSRRWRSLSGQLRVGAVFDLVNSPGSSLLRVLLRSRAWSEVCFRWGREILALIPGVGLASPFPAPGKEKSAPLCLS